jgi:hypothetical protein
MTSAMSIDELAQRCAAETEQYARRAPSDSQFCFELLRRALAESVPEAFTRAYQIYERRVLGWVHGHGSFAQTGEDAGYFASAAWGAFYLSLRGPRFAGFASLDRVLQYLKVCVHSAIVQYIRDQHPAAEPLEGAPDPAHTPDLAARVEAAEAWRRVEQLFPDDPDRLLARCVLVEDLKPRQILAAHPGRWHDEREISVEIYRIRRALRKDPALRRLLGLDESTER